MNPPIQVQRFTMYYIFSLPKNSSSPINEDDDDGGTYTLSFNIEFKHDNDTVYFAHSYPYTYSDLQDYLMAIQRHPVKSKYCKLRLLCRSLAGNNIYYLTVTAPQNDSTEDSSSSNNSSNNMNSAKVTILALANRLLSSFLQIKFHNSHKHLICDRKNEPSWYQLGCIQAKRLPPG